MSVRRELASVEKPVTGAAPALKSMFVKSISGLLRNPWAWLIGVGCLLPVIVSVLATKHALSRDEGAYLTIARGILSGHVPYRDYFDQPGPAIYYVLAALLAATSWLSTVHQTEAVWILIDGVNLFTATGIVLLGRRLWRLEVGMLAAALWLVILPLYLGNDILLEPFATALCVWSALAATSSLATERFFRGGVVVNFLQPLGLSALLAGMILALASIFRQTTVLELPGIVVLLWGRAGAWRDRLRAALLVASGFVVPWLAVCALFAIAGGLGPLIDDVVWVNLLHYQGDTLTVALHDAQLYLSYAPLVWQISIAVSLVGTGLALLRRQLTTSNVLACVLLGVLGWAPLLSHHWLHYWLQALPWACMLTSLGVCWVGVRGLELMRPRARALAAHLTAHSLALVSILGAICAIAGSSAIRAQQSAGASQLSAQVSEVAWLEAHVPANATLLVGPAEPELYFLTARVSPTSYVYLLPVDSSLFPQAAAEIGAGRFQYIAWVHYGERILYYSQIDDQIHSHYHLVGLFWGLAGLPDSECALYELNAPG